jgi:ATP-dependent Clp protease ATP-binding subunit ClpA
MFERFSTQARAAVARARTEAEAMGHTQLDTSHLLLALLSEDAGVAHTVLHRAGLRPTPVRAEVERLSGSPASAFGPDAAAALQSIGIDLDAVLARIEETFGPDALEPPPPPRGRRGNSRFTAGSTKVLELSLREAIHLKDRHIGTAHLLLGLARETSGIAAKILADAGVSRDELRRATLAELRAAA